MSKLYFTYSAMNAGKSALLLQAAHNYQERGMAVSLWAYGHAGDESEGMIRSRIGLEAKAHLFRAGTDLFEGLKREVEERGISAAFLDEAQFLTEDQVWQLAKVGDELRIPVLCYGLRTDFKGKLFEGAATLLAIADDLREARTICHCGRKATMNLRVEEDGAAAKEGPQVGIDKARYLSLCRQHWLERLDEG
ncbi:thymidine kinase [Parvularcula sp. ZS-1/3]|uniref:Thymidine kinase n=1 Tax=Parvularcula mediterranea TaxID=2732508 RepID=A0A7Y3RL19_9PROT|nr:thymidine kinase [Parvularcula mediterranea]NNU15570.1 thymidine kinase [Parvularcula mediterranea]